jgi:nucleosome binding factor SPN SPT16 subunit
MAGGRVLNTKTRGGNRQQPEQTTGEKIKENQRRLHAERAKAGMKKYENGNASNGDGAEKAVKKFESYRREEQLPRSIEDRRIHVDETRQSVILPIYGYAVPFHISTIKNVTKTDATDHMVLRINFQTPGQIAGKKEDMVSRSFRELGAKLINSPSLMSTPPSSDKLPSGQQTIDICSKSTNRSRE